MTVLLDGAGAVRSANVASRSGRFSLDWRR
jgi:hypothetical protein